MAYDLLFGESTASGSTQVYDVLLRLKDRSDVAEFWRDRVGGDKSAIQGQGATLERAAKDALRCHDLDDLWFNIYWIDGSGIQPSVRVLLKWCR